MVSPWTHEWVSPLVNGLLSTVSLRSSDLGVHLKMQPGERLRMKLSAISDSKPSRLEHTVSMPLSRKISDVGDWLPILSGT